MFLAIQQRRQPVKAIQRNRFKSLGVPLKQMYHRYTLRCGQPLVAGIFLVLDAHGSDIMDVIDAGYRKTQHLGVEQVLECSRSFGVVGINGVEADRGMLDTLHNPRVVKDTDRQQDDGVQRNGQQVVFAPRTVDNRQCQTAEKVADFIIAELLAAQADESQQREQAEAGAQAERRVGDQGDNDEHGNVEKRKRHEQVTALVTLIEECAGEDEDRRQVDPEIEEKISMNHA